MMYSKNEVLYKRTTTFHDKHKKPVFTNKHFCLYIYNYYFAFTSVQKNLTDNANVEFVAYSEI